MEDTKGQFDLDRRAQADEIVAGLKTRSLNASIERIAKAADSHGKTDAVARFCDNTINEAVLWALLRAGHLDKRDDASLVVALADDHTTADGADVVSLLSLIDELPAEHAHGQSVPGWPRELDEIVCAVYARDAEPIRSAMGSFSAGVERGLATVRLRFGEIDRTELPSEDWARSLADYHVEREGLGHAVRSKDRGNRQFVRWGSRAADERWGVNVWDHERLQWNSVLYEYIELFTTREEWAAALVQATEERLKREGNVKLADSWDAFLIAEPDTLVRWLGRMCESHTRAWQVFETREFGPPELLDLAKRFSAANEGALADIAAARAMTLMSRAGEPIPDDLAGSLRFEGFALEGTFAWTLQFEGLDPFLEALEALPRERVIQMLLNVFESNRPERALPVAPHYLGEDDGELFAAFMRCVRSESDEKRLERWVLPVRSLALCDVSQLGRIGAAFDRADAAGERFAADALAWALVELLARLADQRTPWPVEYDRFLRFDRWPSDLDFNNILRHSLDRALRGLPEARLEAVFARALDPGENPNFTRPFACMTGDHITDAVLEFAFMSLAVCGGEARASQPNWVRNVATYTHLLDRVDPFVKRALDTGLPEKVQRWLRDGMGEKRWAAVQEP